MQIGRKDCAGWLLGVLLALAALWLSCALCGCRHRPVLLPKPIIRYRCEDGWTLTGETCYIHLQAADVKKVNMAIGATCAAEELGMVVCKKPATVNHIAPWQMPQAM